MRARTLICVLPLLAATLAWGQRIDNGVVQVRALGGKGAYTGFAVRADGAQVAAVLLGSNSAITARNVQASGNVLRFGGLFCNPTPTLGPESFVQVELLPDAPYPKVTFALDLRDFDQAAWEKRFGEVPFHFLICSLVGAEVFHQRGWSIPTPVVDDYVQMKAEGPGRQIVSNWSRDWTYAPPIGAYPMAVVGLWNPSKRRYVGYDFHGARLTDNTEKNFGTSYCFKCGETEQFFCLTWPFGRGYINLRYPQTPVKCGTHFRLLWSQDMGPDDDPNRFVNKFIWRTYADRLPGVEHMNDLSWLPDSHRISQFPTPGRLGDFVHNTGPGGDRWWAPNVNIIGGVEYFSPIDYYYQVNEQESIRKLAAQSRKIIKLGKWMEIDGDRCYFWQTPLDGGGADFFGPGVETFHHVRGWYAGIALLDYCRNDPEGTKDILPYVDGVLRYTKHIIYTRNGYPDVPAAQFAWSGTPAVTFCLKYYYHFRDDPTRADLAKLAYKLARSMTYRYLAIWPCDNDKMDALDSSFLMEPNAGLNWLGCACANEVWLYNIAMLYEYVATGDPIMGHYLRGMLERYHELFRNELHPAVRDYDNAFTERFGLFDECAEGKGERGNFGCLWGGFERLVWPMGSASTRVVCGEKAAMAFNKGGRHTDIADYRYYGRGNFSFRLVAGGLQADPDADEDIEITFPFFELSGKEVAVIRGNKRVVLTDERIVGYPAERSTITIKGLRLGDIVSVGKYDETAAILPCAIAKPRTMPAEDGESVIERDGFEILNLARGAFAGIERDWDDLDSYAGYEPGIKTIYGVPFLLLDPDLTGNQVQVPRQGIAFGDDPEYLFLLVGDIRERSRVTLYRGGKRRERIDLSDAIPVLKGWPPALKWHIDLVVVKNKRQPILSIAPTACKIFAVTSTKKPRKYLSASLDAIERRMSEIAAHRKLVEAIAGLAPLFEPLSGRIAVLPVPGQKDLRLNPMFRMVTEAGLTRHFRFLSPEDLVNPRVFNTNNVWIALYTGGEFYYQNVFNEGDGDRALIRWLKGGGTLVSIAEGPFPFYYNERGETVVSAPKFGLPICGSGAGGRRDTPDVAHTTGWETPPEGLELRFYVNPDQQVLTGLPPAIPWRKEGDQRWRPILDVVSEQDIYTPLVTLKDQQGRKYGEAAAMIDYKAGELTGARVIYLWHSFRLNLAYEQTILTDLLRFLLTHPKRPMSTYTCTRAAQPPVIDGKLDDEVWRQAPPTEAFVRFDEHRSEGKTLETKAMLAWDDDALYVAWECDDPDVWATIRDRDGNLWEEEVVELYVDPDGDGRNYKEFEINPLNAVVDLNIPYCEDGSPHDIPGALGWNATGLETAVRVDGTIGNPEDRDVGWTCEAAIPMRNFTTARSLPPRVGDTWRAQLLRINRSTPRSGGPADASAQFLAWSLTDTFHNPSRFGRILFGGNPCYDDFSAYPEGASPAPIWAVTSGEWKIVDGELVGKNSGTDAWSPTGVVTGETSWRNYRLRVRFQMRERGSDHRDGPWIGFRYSGEDSCYSLNFGEQIRLQKVYNGHSGGDISPLSRAEWSCDRNWHEVVIVVKGEHITVALDGNQIINTTDTNALGVGPVPAGGVCLSARRWSGSMGDTVVAFDDFAIERLQ